MAAKKILIVLHQEHSTPGRVGRLLAESGHVLDIRRPRFGDPLPATMEQHDGAIIFGGPMSANDPDDYVREEIDWIRVPLKEGKPYLGICLGGQMMARHLGARVYEHPQGRAEIGYYPLRARGEDALAAGGVGLPSMVYQWHREGFDLPAGAEWLAESEGDFPVQAFRYGPAAYALQFHPEVTYAMMCRWTTRAHERLALPGARPQRDHLDGWFQHDGAVARWIAAFLKDWLEPAPESGKPAAPPARLVTA